MAHSGFAHLNTTIVKTKLFRDIGGFDDNSRYEEDRDLYLRIIDAAESIIYLPVVIARHNIPNSKAQDNVTKIVSNLDKRLFQIRLLDKAILFACNRAVRNHGKRHKGHTLKKIAEEMYGLADYEKASYYAREALLIGLTWKWLLFTIYVSAIRIFKPPK